MKQATPQSSTDCHIEPWPADVHTWIAQVAALDQTQRVDALQRDQIARWQSGERVPAEAYLQLLEQCPDAKARADHGLDLVYGEFLLRRQDGEDPTLEEFCWRFPHFAEQLTLLVELERGLETPPSPDAETQERHPQTLPKNAAASQWPTIPEYEILSELGRGGMGVVYKARHQPLNRVVALKMVLAGAHARPEQRERFLAEAAAVARLNHPNIVHVYEIGQYADAPYFTMEYVDGGSLADQLAGQAQPPRRAAQIIETLARAVHAAHQQRIIHRDLKPANILTTSSGDLKIADFGLAKLLEDEPGRTRTGDVLGSPSYMAPEQAAGKTKELGPATDTYALGAMLHELLTGRPPFQAQTPMDTLWQVLTVEPEPLRRRLPSIPRDLETVCLKCLEKEPSKRYASALELADELERFLAGEPIRARPIGAGERAWRWTKRRPAVAALLAVIVIASTVGLPAMTGLWLTAVTARGNAEQARGKEAIERQRAESSLYSSNIARAQLEWRANHLAPAEQVLARCPVDQRGWEWHFLQQQCRTDLLTLRGHTGQAVCVSYSPDGRSIASAGGGNVYYRNPGQKVVPGEIILWDAASGAVRLKLRGHTHLVNAVAFSPDGRTLASASHDRTAKIWDVESGSELANVVGHEKAVWNVAFSPDGRRLVTSSDDWTAAVWELGSRTPSRVLTLRGHREPVRAAAYSPDGRWIVTASSDPAHGEAKVWNAANGHEAQALEANQARFAGVAVSPDSRRLAASSDRGVQVWDLATGRLSPKQFRQTEIASCVTFSRDGRYVAAGLADTTVRVWQVADASETLVFRGHTELPTSVAFSPDGQRLASTGRDGVLKVWDLTLHPEYAPVQTEPGLILYEPEAIAFSTDSSRLLVAQRGGPITILENETFALLARPAVDLSNTWQTPATLACFDGAGQWLAGISRANMRDAVCWNALTGKIRCRLAGHTLPLRHVVMNYTGQRIATASLTSAANGMRAEVRVWDAVTGQLVRAFDEEAVEVTALALSPRGDRIVIGGLKRNFSAATPGKAAWFVRVTDTESGAELGRHTDADDAPGGAAFSPDGSRIAVVGRANGTVLLWDLEGGQAVITKEGPPQAMDVSYSPDGRRLAVASRLLVKVLNATTGEEVLSLRGLAQMKTNTSGFNPRARFSPDSQHLAAICHDGGESLSVWSVTDNSPEGQAKRRRLADRRALLRRLREAAACVTDRDAAGLQLHLPDLARAKLETPTEYVCRARLFLETGDMDRARADYQQAFEMPDSQALEPIIWFEWAALRLLCDDRAGYLQMCRQMEEHLGATSNPEHGAWLARTALLDPACGIAPERLLALAQEAVKSHTGQPWYRHIRSLAIYRSGRLDEAIQEFQAAQRQFPVWCENGLDELWLARAQARASGTKEAREWKNKLRAALAQAVASMPLGARHVHDRLERLCLRREVNVEESGDGR